MISEDRKREIVEEETVRSEVRRHFEASGPKQNRIWKFLNSAFALWLFSTFFVSLGAYFFKLWDNRLENARRNAEYFVRLETEFAHRVSFQLYALQLYICERGAEREYEVVRSDAAPRLRELLLSIDSSNGPYTATHQDLSKISTVALLSEIRRLQPKWGGNLQGFLDLATPLMRLNIQDDRIFVERLTPIVQFLDKIRGPLSHHPFYGLRRQVRWSKCGKDGSATGDKR